jgi:ribosome assembly protein 4
LNRPRPSWVASVAFSADGKTLAAGEYERGVTLWDPETLKQKGGPSADRPAA